MTVPEISQSVLDLGQSSLLGRGHVVVARDEDTVAVWHVSLMQDMTGAVRAEPTGAYVRTIQDSVAAAEMLSVIDGRLLVDPGDDSAEPIVNWLCYIAGETVNVHQCSVAAMYSEVSRKGGFHFGAVGSGRARGGGDRLPEFVRGVAGLVRPGLEVPGLPGLAGLA